MKAQPKVRVVGERVYYLGEHVATLQPGRIPSLWAAFIKWIERFVD